MIERSNNISDWVASHILVQSTLAAQSNVVELFLEIGKWCESLGNYFACSGIFGGFSKWCISRLTKTWKVKHSHKLLHAHLHHVISEEKNYAMYRGMLAERLHNGKPCVPHLGVFLRDLTFVEDGNPDFTNDGTPNLNKITLIGDIIAQIKTLQSVRFSNKNRNEDVFLLSRLWTLPRRDDAWLEKRSTELRPMMVPAGTTEDTSFVSTSTKSEDSSEDHSFVLEEVADLSEGSAQSGANKTP